MEMIILFCLPSQIHAQTWRQKLIFVMFLGQEYAQMFTVLTADIYEKLTFPGMETISTRA